MCAVCEDRLQDTWSKKGPGVSLKQSVPYVVNRVFEEFDGLDGFAVVAVARLNNEDIMKPLHHVLGKVLHLHNKFQSTKRGYTAQRYEAQQRVRKPTKQITRPAKQPNDQSSPSKAACPVCRAYKENHALANDMAQRVHVAISTCKHL